MKYISHIFAKRKRYLLFKIVFYRKLKYMDKLDEIIKKSTDKVIDEFLNRNCEPLLEMARIDEPSKDSNIYRYKGGLGIWK